jgi:alpha-L-rhamnosidase
MSADVVARVAQALGKTADGEKYRAMANGIADAFVKKYYNEETGLFGSTQAANLLPIVAGMVPQKVRGRAAGFIRDDIVYTHNTHLTTGILGTKYLLPWLATSGNPDLAYELAAQTTYPSWGFMMERGATTVWELWQEKTGPSMNSHNHPMFGSIGTYFLEYLAGIQNPEAGYTKIRIAPQVVRDLNYASGSIDSIRGPVISSWSRQGDSLRLETVVPFGSTAEIVLPKMNLRDVSVVESGKTVWAGGKYEPGISGVLGAHESGGNVVIDVASGSYTFERRGI